MKRAPWLTVLVVAAAMLAIVPTTLAIGEPGTTLYASLGANRFPAGTGVTALGKLHFISDDAIRFDVTINGNQTKVWTARIYSRGSCAAVLNWVANRNAATDPAGYLDVMSNAGEVQHQLVARDVNRVRAALGRGETLVLMVAGTDNAGATYRTCTALTATVPPTSTLPPVTTSSTPGSATTPVTTSATTPVTTATSSATTATTGSTTNTSVSTTTSQLTTISTPTGAVTTICIPLTDLPITETSTLPVTITTATSVTTITITSGTSVITTTSTTTLPPQACFPAS